MEELGGLGRIEAFQKQSPEADAVFGVARIPRNERFKGSLRFLIAVLFPKRSEEHTSELQSLRHLVCRLLLEKKMTCDTSVAVRAPTGATLHVTFINVVL